MKGLRRLMPSDSQRSRLLFDGVTRLVSEGGYLAIVGLMFAENIFPPIPSELIMPLAGYVAAQGHLDPYLAVLAGAFGSVLGALPWYYAGVRLGRERVCALAARHGRWLTVNEKDVGKAIDWFERRGRLAVLLGRCVPAVRTLISVPAGIARMPLMPFLLYSTIGTLVWTTALLVAGYMLGSQYRTVGQYVDMASKVILGLVVVLYVWRVMAGGSLGEWVRTWARELRRDVYTVYFAARDARTPWYVKALAILVVAYAVSPVDLVPDFIPVVGHLDDVILVPLGIMLVVRLIPDDMLEQHRRSAAEMDGEPRDWRVGALFILVWLIALAFLIRWGLERFVG
jgi:membrane protein DedA with SNARE-associated domain/uncharacterized membrane protein YkvA (DUF1232 family)